MTSSEREEFKVWFRANYADKVMAVKGPEYSGTGRGSTQDVNGNFKRVGELLGIDPLVVAAVYFLKHLDAILTYIKLGTEGSEPIYGRFGDAYNYIEIMASLVAEQKGDPEIIHRANAVLADAARTLDGQLPPVLVQ